MRISIALCTFNGEKWLSQQLNSLQEQTHPPDELIVCDDCSSDSTLSILEAFASQAPFDVKIYQNPQNLGSTRNFEKAVSLCSGEIIFLCDQDDVWLPHKVETMLEEFKRDPKIGIVFSDAYVVDSQLRFRGDTIWESVKASKKIQKQYVSRADKAVLASLKHSICWGMSFAFRNKYLSILLPIPYPQWTHDKWIAFLILCVARGALIGEPLTYYRLHGNNVSGAPDMPGNFQETVKLALNSTRNRQLRKINQIEQAISIIEGLEAYSDLDHVISTLKRYVEHQRVRAELPKQLITRLAITLPELVLGRYHRYSSGSLSFMKDVLQNKQ